MNIILTILCSLYGLYCITFIIAICWTLYKERQEEIRRQYSSIIEVDGFIDSDDETPQY